MEIKTEILHVVPKDTALHYRIIPFAKNEQGLELYCDVDTDDEQLSDELQVVLGYEVNLHKKDNAEISRLLSTYYLGDAHVDQSETVVSEISSGGDFLNTLIEEAKKLKSSDIHIETFEQKSRVRIRIDGMMIERYQIIKEDYPSLVNKIKIMANLDIAEKRLPQDGRIQYRSAKQSAFDIRVSVLPTLHGEKIVLRLLNNNSTDIDLNTLGLSEEDMFNYMQGVQRPNGIILISGPTGSGKTTTLYATLKLLNKSTRNILTIEDPIEYTLEGINQVQLKESIGLGFASALRTFLRQDPDVIMVGEIRDPETANMAIRAALTGHLVLSTIHTNSAWGTVSRLMDMGIPSFLVANTLNTSVAQRLVRLLCPACKEAVSFNSNQYPKQFRAPVALSQHYIAKGCSQCFYTGYKGRKAVYEVIPIDADLSQEIRNGNMTIGNILKEKNINTLSGNAFALFADGLTSLEEIYPLLLTI
ncbi:GspE/PulE family protein [Pedobacter rhizosphaerae]|uniref:General secretion pathway protein E n=1 Tax=Pedobacter rhizosphaerae TaxID=390241 RepID=A0A1H9VF36_9SPHI|nr:GspE/PulE family protein [Pedobacter rhizosphaerae]SES20386.1 general secretion pathway protein E [Pedobacter rhizosphaerae]